MSERTPGRPGGHTEPAEDDRPGDPVQALTDFLAAVVEAPPRPGSEDDLGQPGDRDRRGE